MKNSDLSGALLLAAAAAGAWALASGKLKLPGSKKVPTAGAVPVPTGTNPYGPERPLTGADWFYQSSAEQQAATQAAIEQSQRDLSNLDPNWYAP